MLILSCIFNRTIHDTPVTDCDKIGGAHAESCDSQNKPSPVGYGRTIRTVAAGIAAGIAGLGIAEISTTQNVSQTIRNRLSLPNMTPSDVSQLSRENHRQYLEEHPDAYEDAPVCCQKNARLGKVCQMIAQKYYGNYVVLEKRMNHEQRQYVVDTLLRRAAEVDTFWQEYVTTVDAHRNDPSNWLKNSKNKGPATFYEFKIQAKNRILNALLEKHGLDQIVADALEEYAEDTDTRFSEDKRRLFSTRSATP